MRNLLISAILLVSFSANAGVFIEPYLGSTSVTSKLTGPSYSAEDDSSALNYGARLGYQFLLLSIGADLNFYSDDADGTEITWNRTTLVAGIHLPMIKFWAEYGISSKYSNKDNDGTTNFDYKDGFEVGIGYTGLPFVSINLEYFTHNYSPENFSDYTLAQSGTMFSLSVPLP